MFLEILHEQTVDFNVTDVIRTLGVLGAQELGRFQFTQQLIVCFIYYSFKLNAFCTNFMTVSDGWRLDTDAKSTDAVLDAFSNRGSERNDNKPATTKGIARTPWILGY